MAKIENAGNARPQKHDAMTIDASKPARETEKPLNHKVTQHGSRTTPKRSGSVEAK